MIIPVLCLTAELAGAGPVLALYLLVVGIAIVFKTSKTSDGKSGFSNTLLRIFFLAAACHVVVGYLIAAPTSRLIWIGTNAPNAYAKSFLVIAAGLFAATLGYAWSISRPKLRVGAYCNRLHFNDTRLFMTARFIVLLGIALIALVYAHLGIVPMLADSPGAARYFNYQVSDDYLLYEWLVSRGMDLLTFGLPLVAASALWNKKWIDRLLTLAGTAAILLPLRRANLMSAVVVLVLMQAMKTGKSVLRYGAVFLVLLLAYAASQLFFINLFGGADFDEQTAFSVSGSALPEVRDLGWTIDLLQDERLNGTTFLQALVPVPSLISDFSQTHSLRYVTSRLIGLDAERHTGGLRLTLAGEAFLNFGYFGPAGIGFLFGILCTYVQAAANVLSEHHADWANYTAGTILVWVCFWLYLSGTQSAATIKVGTALLLVTLYLSRFRSGQLPSAASAS
jgi:hypothetical protein